MIREWFFIFFLKFSYFAFRGRGGYFNNRNPNMGGFRGGYRTNFNHRGRGTGGTGRPQPSHPQQQQQQQQPQKPGGLPQNKTPTVAAGGNYTFFFFFFKL